MVERRSSWYWLGPVLLGVGLYALTIRGVFIYDDVWSCKLDGRLAHPSDWGKFWYQGYMPEGADNLWRPLVSMSYAVQAWGNGDRFWAFHLVNILLHGLACGLVAELGRRLCDRKVGLIAGLLFAAHPVHVEAVAGIVGRAEEMAMIGVLAGLLTFIGRTLTTRRAIAIVGWFLFAAFSKEQGLLLPVFLLVWYRLEKWGPAVTTVSPAAADTIDARGGGNTGVCPSDQGGDHRGAEGSAASDGAAHGDDGRICGISQSHFAVVLGAELSGSGDESAGEKRGSGSVADSFCGAGAICDASVCAVSVEH